jgi:hypothetical protein
MRRLTRGLRDSGSRTYWVMGTRPSKLPQLRN